MNPPSFTGIVAPTPASCACLAVSGSHTNPKHVFGSLAANSARKAEELTWEEWAERLTRYYGTLERLLSPDLFVVGGGVTNVFVSLMQGIGHDDFSALGDSTGELPLSVPRGMANSAGV